MLSIEFIAAIPIAAFAVSVAFAKKFLSCSFGVASRPANSIFAMLSGKSALVSFARASPAWVSPKTLISAPNVLLLVFVIFRVFSFSFITLAAFSCAASSFFTIAFSASFAALRGFGALVGILEFSSSLSSAPTSSIAIFAISSILFIG